MKFDCEFLFAALAEKHNAVYRLSSRMPKSLSEQERADCIAMNRDLVDEYSNALLRAYREIFNFLFAANGNTTFDAVAGIIKAIRAEHAQTRRQIIKAINTRNIDGLGISGPRTPECRNQVLAVVRGRYERNHNAEVINSPLFACKEKRNEKRTFPL